MSQKDSTGGDSIDANAAEPPGEEPESRDKKLRAFLDKVLTQSIYGEIIVKGISIISIASSVLFIIMLDTDHAGSDPCCKDWVAAGKPDDMMPDCNPPCNEFYYSRMPRWFELIDMVICIIYLVYYILIVFISQDRCKYFISDASIQELLIIVPVLIYPYECGALGLFLKGVSRTTRLFKIDAFIKASESSVSDEIKRIAIEMFLTVIMSTVLFMIIENFNLNGDTMLLERYDFLITLYFIFVTVSTVGYGDFYPVTQEGRAFIAGLILYIIIYRLPMYISRITELTARNSPYSVGRQFY